MKPSKRILRRLLLFTAISCVLVGCSRDPKTRRDKFLRSGQRYFEKGDYQAASIQLRRALQIDPRFAEGHYRLALSDLRLRQWQDAYLELHKSIEIDPNYVPPHLALAEFYFAGRRTSDARQELRVVLRQEPNNLDAHLLLGRIALYDKKYDESLREFLAGQQIAPENSTPFTQAGDVYVLLKLYSKAEQAFQQAIDADASYIPAYLDLARAYRLQGESNSEISVLQNAIDHNPKQITPYVAEAAAYVRQGRSGEVPTLFAKLRSTTADDAAALLAIGEFYFATGDVFHGKSALHDALAKDAKNKTVRSRLIELDLNQHDWDEAERLNGEFLKADPSNPMGRLFQARLQFVRGAKARAVTSLEQLVHDNPEMALPRFYLGLAYANQGQADRAVSELNDSLRRDPDFIWAYIGLAELYAQQGSPKLALDFANQALAHNSSFVPAMLLQANAYMQLGDYHTAIVKLETLRTTQPKNPAVLERLAVAAINQKQFVQAEQHLEEALLLQPDYVPAMLDLVRLYGLQKRPAGQIINRVQKQLTASPKQGSFYEILGEAYFEKQDAPKAQQAFEDALSVNETATEARVQLARLYASQGNLAAAIQNAQKVLELHPDFLQGYMLLGSLYEETGDVVKAEQVYQQALERNPDFAPALNNLAWLYCENGGNLDMALSLAQKAKAKIPAAPSVSDTLAWIQYRKGLYASAASILEDITKQYPQNATYRYHFGMTLWRADRSSEARQALQGALQLNIKPKDAAEARRVLVILGQRAGTS
jgi:tetratricopeptide (TPR) repeat protein